MSGYTDTDTGMIKFGTRYYMPDLGIWTQPDPETGHPSNPMSLNAYSYVAGDPVNNVDPTGRWLSDREALRIAGITLSVLAVAASGGTAAVFAGLAMGASTWGGAMDCGAPGAVAAGGADMWGIIIGTAAKGVNPAAGVATDLAFLAVGQGTSAAAC